MQPNKSVEEIEQIIKYFRGRTGGWGMVLDKSILEIEEDLRKNIQELLTSHTNTVLQGVVERVEGNIRKVKYCADRGGVHTPCTSCEYGLSTCQYAENDREYNQGLNVAISLLNDQIISNEK